MARRCATKRSSFRRQLAAKRLNGLMEDREAVYAASSWLSRQAVMSPGGRTRSAAESAAFRTENAAEFRRLRVQAAKLEREISNALFEISLLAGSR